MRFILLILTSLILVGCESAHKIQNTYGDDALPIEKIGILKGGTKYKNWIESTTVTFISYARVAEGKVGATTVFGTGIFAHYPHEIHMLPGSYIVKIRCDENDKYQYLNEEFEVTAGDTVNISCEWKTGGIWLKDGTFEITKEKVATQSIENSPS